MNKSIKIYIAILVLILVAIIYIDAHKPKPIDWTPTYAINDKIPLGMFVFDQEIKSVLKDQKIEKIKTSPYEFFINKLEYDDDNGDESYNIKGTFLNIADISTIDKESVKEILYFVSSGNNAFISAENLPEFLLDTLKIKTKVEQKYNDTIYNWVANKNLDTQKYKFIEGVGNQYFSEIDTLKTTVLGYQSGDSTRVNFIRIKYNDGNIYLHTQPVAFTNFHLLKDNHYQYAEKILSYIPKGDIFWYIKNQDSNEISGSPLSYIFSQSALKWAWLMFIFGMIFFMIFNAKRKQRIVPIINPLPNTTIEFTKTIGNLYYQEGDHDNIINKKIIYFLEKIRNQYLIETNKLDDEFIKKLHQKSGRNLVDIQKVVFLINTHKRSPHNSVEEDLIQINNAIEKIVS